MPIVSLVAAALVAACLLVLAFIHVYWGLGGAWPARTRAELGPMVVGTPPRDANAMPDLAACLIVAGLLITAATLIVGARLHAEPSWIWRVGSAGVGVVLALRGVGGYFDARLRPATREQPFFALNRRIYSPLCLVLASLITLVLVAA
ncbi:DUF3995 domain-containing protein [Nannocystaceae bacterium ST9]